MVLHLIKTIPHVKNGIFFFHAKFQSSVNKFIVTSRNTMSVNRNEYHIYVPKNLRPEISFTTVSIVLKCPLL